MLKNVLKFLGIGLGIVALGVGALFGIRYLQYRNSPEYQALAEMKKLEKAYAQDPYGGETPEETLRLFIDALKKGDTDLAAKYFVLDVQPEWKEGLAKIKERGLLDEMVRDLERLKNKYPLIEGDDKRFVLEAYNDGGELVMQADLGKSLNGKWKILDL